MEKKQLLNGTMESTENSGVTFAELIVKKRDGKCLSKEEIQSFVDQVVHHKSQECQIGAMLMAMYLRGLSDEETIHLTYSMLHSGDILQWPPEWKSIVADKHSTGGVGDKASLPLAPALAACGLKVPMVSGRGLGFTGGTLDKLEAIPGFNTQCDEKTLRRCMEKVGCFIAGSSARVAPADRELYAIRDVTGTVESPGLVTGSIISKKAAEGISALVMDVKMGRASVAKSINEAHVYAQSLIRVAHGLGLKTKAVISKMDTPIGRTIGNALEVEESIECMKGKGPGDLVDLIGVLGGVLLEMTGKARNEKEGKALVIGALNSGSALDHFERMLACQGVDPQAAKELCRGDPKQVLPQAPSVSYVTSPSTGYIEDIDALELGMVSNSLGGGRQKSTDRIDHSVGLRLLWTLGDHVTEGEPWLEVHHQDRLNEEVLRRLSSSITLAKRPPKDAHNSHVLEIMDIKGSVKQ